MIYCALIICSPMACLSLGSVLKSGEEPFERGISLVIGTVSVFGIYGCAQTLGWVV